MAEIAGSEKRQGLHLGSFRSTAIESKKNSPARPSKMRVKCESQANPRRPRAEQSHAPAIPWEPSPLHRVESRSDRDLQPDRQIPAPSSRADLAHPDVTSTGYTVSACTID